MKSDHDGRGEIWGLVLAGGDGTRLAGWAHDEAGLPAPKQYCALGGDSTLFARTVDRLARLVPKRRILAVVAEHHHKHWRREARRLPAGHLVVQPANRGTAAGILLPLLTLAERDPEARVVITPSDHHVEHERPLAAAIAEALSALERPLDRLLLIGISPDAPAGDLGWIVPGGKTGDRVLPVERFVEKPGVEEARRLERRGAVWNSFLLVSRVGTLLDLYAERLPGLLATLSAARQLAGRSQPSALAATYAELPSWDFSRDLLQGAEQRLGVVIAPPCGWTDLGTPERLRRCHRGPLGVTMKVSRDVGAPGAARAVA